MSLGDFVRSVKAVKVLETDHVKDRWETSYEVLDCEIARGTQGTRNRGVSEDGI